MTKHKKVRIWKKYKVSRNEIIKKGKECPRCGSGVFLAEHGERTSCGKCGFSKIKVSN